VPVDTEVRIEEICRQIRELCGKPHTPRSENRLRKLAVELRDAIEKHVKAAQSSLGAKKSAILGRDKQEP
jgi:hypothetical protein